MFDALTVNKLKYYVYALIDPRTKKPFYIGKGSGNRLFQHVEDALETNTESDKLNLIRDIKSLGYKIDHIIIRHGLDEDDAFKIESSLIDLLDHIGFNLKNEVLGHHAMEYGIMKANDVISQYNAKPLKKLAHDIVIININRAYKRGKGEKNIYEATHEAWVISEKRRNTIEYALSEYRGIIVGVFKVNNWYNCKRNDRSGLKGRRWGFNGINADENIRNLYLNKSIKHIKKKGSANPIRYKL